MGSASGFSVRLGGRLLGRVGFGLLGRLGVVAVLAVLRLVGRLGLVGRFGLGRLGRLVLRLVLRRLGRLGHVGLVRLVEPLVAIGLRDIRGRGGRLDVRIAAGAHEAQVRPEGDRADQQHATDGARDGEPESRGGSPRALQRQRPGALDRRWADPVVLRREVLEPIEIVVVHRASPRARRWPPRRRPDDVDTSRTCVGAVRLPVRGRRWSRSGQDDGPLVARRRPWEARGDAPARASSVIRPPQGHWASRAAKTGRIQPIPRSNRPGSRHTPAERACVAYRAAGSAR